jgi:hypothetical protein
VGDEYEQGDGLAEGDRDDQCATRTTAIISEAIWPTDGERIVHGNVSFTSAYFLRAADLAAQAGAGLALVHSHGITRMLIADERHLATI